MSPAGVLNRVEHTLLCSKFLRAHFAVHRQQDNSDSRAQEREGHVLGTKTVILCSHEHWSSVLAMIRIVVRDVALFTLRNE